MRSRYALPLILAAAMAACSGGSEPTAPADPTPAAPKVLLSEVVIPNLPSPYYHFDYDTAGRITGASFASQLRVYDVTYVGGRISVMQIKAGSGDRLEYLYDTAGRVSVVKYVNSSGVVFTRLILTYDGQKLIEIERQKSVDGGFIIDKTTSLSYYADGNLRELKEHRPAIAGQQDETTTTDLYEQYDDKTNVDGFGLIHSEFFDHLILLPGVQLQKGNPARETRSGDGINYTVAYTYTYDDRKRPLAKIGQATLLNGTDAGKVFPTRSDFSYY